MKYKLQVMGIAIMLALLAPFGALVVSAASQADLSLSIIPEFPMPGKNIKAEAMSYVFDTLRANFQWYLNGKVVVSGKGITEQTFLATKVGTIMNIKVVAVASDGLTYAASASVPISDIDLIMRADTYTPNGYRGASLPTPGSILEVYAVPYLYSGGAKISVQNLIYEWFLDDKKMSGLSGQGKNKIILELPNLGSGEYEIKLKASSISGSVVMEKNMKISTQTPRILFYETNPLAGRSSRAFSIFNIKAGGSFAILAEPYFFDLRSLARAAFSWSTANTVIERTSENPRILEIAAPQDAQSSTDFALSINDKKTIFQRAEAVLTVIAQP